MVKRAVWPMALAWLCVACSGEGGGARSSSSSGGGGPQSGGGSSGSSSSSSGGGGGSKKPLGHGPCEAASECEGDLCVSIIDEDNPPNYCTQECPNGSCPGGYRCDSTTFELVGRSFCRFGETPPQGGMEETPSEPPRIPCREDGDCDAGEVCGTYQGEKECTLRCSVEQDCDLPAVGGFGYDFMQCGPDDNPNVTRTICVPDPACFMDPSSCISF